MTSSHWNLSNKLASPSNMTIAVLVGFLFVGHTSDWRILHGRPARPARLEAALPSGIPIGSKAQRVRPGESRLVEPGSSANSVVADNRPVIHDGKSRREID